MLSEKSTKNKHFYPNISQRSSQFFTFVFYTHTDTDLKGHELQNPTASNIPKLNQPFETPQHNKAKERQQQNVKNLLHFSVNVALKLYIYSHTGTVGMGKAIC